MSDHIFQENLEANADKDSVKARRAICLPKITNALIREKCGKLITETIVKTAASGLYLKRKVDKTGVITFPMFM
jgi:hypothetical protein